MFVFAKASSQSLLLPCHAEFWSWSFAMDSELCKPPGTVGNAAEVQALVTLNAVKSWKEDNDIWKEVKEEKYSPKPWPYQASLTAG